MSRARIATDVHTVADNPDQAAADLTTEWTVDRRQRWTLDVDAPANPADRIRPSVTRRIDDSLREARIRAEQQALRELTGPEWRRVEPLDVGARLARLSTRPAAGRDGLGI